MSIRIGSHSFNHATAKVMPGMGNLFVVSIVGKTNAGVGPVPIDFFYRKAEADRLAEDLNAIPDRSTAVVIGGRAKVVLADCAPVAAAG